MTEAMTIEWRRRFREVLDLMHHRSFFVLALIFSCRLLQADIITAVTVTPGPPVWSYTLFNNEPANSPNFITAFTLSVAAPIAVTGTPTGWDFLTDDLTFVQWFNTDLALPYLHDIAPGTSLGGFSVSSTAVSSQLLSYGLSGWDHTADAPGPGASGNALAPSEASSSVPEPSTAYFLSYSILAMAVLRHRTRRFSVPSVTTRPVP
jgi:hypothetical protein